MSCGSSQIVPCAPGQGDTLGVSQGHGDLWQRGHCAVPGHPIGPCWGGKKIFEKNFQEIILFLKLTSLGGQQQDTSVLFPASVCFGSRSICGGAWNRCRFLGPSLSHYPLPSHGAALPQCLLPYCFHKSLQIHHLFLFHAFPSRSSLGAVCRALLYPRR